MPFNCTIRFTGLCAFVPHRPLQQAPERMCVVLVNGKSEGTRAVDGTELRQHLGFVLFDLRNLPPGTAHPKQHQGVWYLDRQRVVIDTDGADLDTTSYIARIDTEFNISAPQAGETTSFAWIAGLTKLMPDFSAIDPSCVSTNDVSAPPPASVLAQVFFNKGRLSAEEPANQVWSVSSALSTQVTRQPFAHEAVLTLTGVTRLRLAATAMPGGLNDVLELVPGPLGRIELTIANLCDDNPLRWPRSPKPADDDDFKWYYELMARPQQTQINQRRRGAPLPTPQLERRRLGPNATGINCFPVRVADIPFNMP